MNDRAEKTMKLCMALYMAALFMIVAPAHHHEDHQEHSDCIVCMIAHQPAQVSVTFALAIVVSSIIVNLVYPPSILVSQVSVTFQSRAPPIL